MRRIAILGKLPPPYMGPSIATEIILNSSLKDRFQLIHINTKANESLATLGKWSIKKVFKNIEIYFNAWKIIKNKKPELVLIPISQTTIGFLKDSVFILIARTFNKKIVLHLRGSVFLKWVSNSSALNKWFVKRVLKSTNGVIVLGNNLRYLFENYFSTEKIFVVPNGSNYEVLSKPSESKTILNLIYLANLQSSKGIEDVIEAAVILKTKYKRDFTFDVVGAWRKDETKQKCLAIVKENNLPVNFFPPVSGAEKFKHLSRADIFIFTPREPEGHPWVIVEAMASSLPIISTDQGAIIESVLDGQNGFIVSPNNPNQIAEKINTLFEDENLRMEMGARSRKLYEEKFTEEKMVENLSKVFETVLKTH